jgi:hypothetical protein
LAFKGGSVERGAALAQALLRCGGTLARRYLRRTARRNKLKMRNRRDAEVAIMKIVVGIVFGALAVLGLSLAAGRNAPDRPPGIAADHWAPISATLGVVLVPDPDLSVQQPLAVGASGMPAISDSISRVDRRTPLVAPGFETELLAQPKPAVQAIIEEGFPVRGYIMVKRGKVWRPLTVVPPTVNN